MPNKQQKNKNHISQQQTQPQPQHPAKAAPTSVKQPTSNQKHTQTTKPVAVTATIHEFKARCVPASHQPDQQVNKALWYYVKAAPMCKSPPIQKLNVTSIGQSFRLKSNTKIQGAPKLAFVFQPEHHQLQKALYYYAHDNRTPQLKTKPTKKVGATKKTAPQPKDVQAQKPQSAPQKPAVVHTKPAPTQTAPQQQKAQQQKAQPQQQKVQPAPQQQKVVQQTTKHIQANKQGRAKLAT
ncbi:Aste57867_2645 [Aphanomyces stellatus]|uniref:Aste57867_2645 protein n=1 Tax=Aphanomyces stellatus TaxID=120398 RepID=A0A485KDP8_9STRA|nr:hypothetical protein As57867_002638 [Aphanomyces stellatus]VFT79840.1 Aste57867_2645 [Aphanomyces stellatus]